MNEKYYTFGGSKAATILMGLLMGEFKFKLKSVSRLLIGFNYGLNQIQTLEDKQVRETLMLLWFKDYKEKTEKYPDELRSFVKNVLSVHYRKRMK